MWPYVGSVQTSWKLFHKFYLLLLQIDQMQQLKIQYMHIYYRSTIKIEISLNCWINICRFYNILHSSFSWSFIYEVYLTFKRFICRYRVLLFYCNEFFRKIEITFSFKSLFLPFPQTFVNILYADPDELFGAIIIIWSLDSTQQKSQNFPYDLKSINI